MSDWQTLFDGTAGSLEGWKFAGKGSFELVEGSLEARAGDDLGLLWWSRDAFSDFRLVLLFRIDRVDDNSGVFVRFRDPTKPVPSRDDPNARYPYDNQAWVGVHTGFEIQIDELGRGGKPENLTGAIYEIPVGKTPGTQRFRRPHPLVPGRWNELDVLVRGDSYDVKVNGLTSAVFDNVDAYRGKPASRDPESGYVGLQTHTGRVAFRDVRIRRL